MKERNIIIRVFAAISWLVLIYFSTSIFIGAIVGGIAGSNTDSYDAGYIAGQKASMEFSQNYGLFVLAGQLLLFAFLAYKGLLPGTIKYKGNKQS